MSVDAITAPAPAPVATLEMTPGGRRLVLAAAFLGWLCAGMEMGLLPVATRPAVRDLLFGQAATLTRDQEVLVGTWFAWYLAAFLLGGALGGLLFGRLGDVLGRVRAMGLSILVFSTLTGASWLVQTPEQLLVVRFLASLGIGGMWPAGVALVAEAWPDRARPTVAGVIGTAANLGILAFALLARQYKITPDSWRWAMLVGGSPVLLGVLVLLVVPESPRWRAARARSVIQGDAPDAWAVFVPPYLGRTLTGICLGTIPLLGTWGSTKWMLPWVDKELGAAAAADTQAVWAVGAALGSAAGGWLATLLGRRLTYFVISAATLLLNLWIYRFLDPHQALFLPAVFLVGLVATVFFGWLPLYLPELFPTRVRATGSGVAFNFGRFASAAGVLAAGGLLAAFEGSYARIGETTAWVYCLGLVVILFAPDTQSKKLED